MFAETKNAVLIATAIYLTGVLGHGFVRKITIDGEECVLNLFECWSPKVSWLPLVSLV